MPVIVAVAVIAAWCAWQYARGFIDEWRHPGEPYCPICRERHERSVWH